MAHIVGTAREVEPTQFETLATAAARLGVNPRTLRRRIADGSIVAYRFGDRLIRLDPDEVNRTLRRIPS